MRATLTAIGACALGLAFAGPAGAATFTPTTFDDQRDGNVAAHCPPGVVETDPANDCSVREALLAARNAAGEDTIALSAGRYTLVSTLVIRDGERVTIKGAGARATTIDRNSPPTGGGRVIEFSDNPGAEAADGELRDLALTGGAPDFDGMTDGGAILVEDDGEGSDAQGALYRVRVHGNRTFAPGGAIANQGKLSISASLIDGNVSGSAAGAIENDDSMSLLNTTVTGNKVEDSFDPDGAGGGGIRHDAQMGGDTPALEITNSTITANTTEGLGGGINSFDEAPVRLRNSIVSGNTAQDSEAGNVNDNCAGPVTSEGYNLENGTSCGLTATGDLTADPKLGALADNGGPTNTHALPTGSPAIDAAPSLDCPEEDQRGTARTGKCDIGAFEFAAGKPPVKPPVKPRPRPRTPRQPQPKPPVPSKPGSPLPPKPDCADSSKPVTTLKRTGVIVRDGRVTLRGRSKDRNGKCPSGLRRVEVSLAKVSGTGLNCRFLQRPNRFLLTPFQNCRRPVLFTASGKKKWSYGFRVNLAPGKYRAQARARDMAGNKETPRKRRNIVFFEVK
jgi:hypothetical protein